MDTSLTLTSAAFDALAREARRDRPRVLFAPLGIGWLTDRVDLLVHPVRLSLDDDPQTPWLEVVLAPDPGGLATALAAASPDPRVRARLALGAAAATGVWAGWSDTGHGRGPLHRLRVMGPGLLEATAEPSPELLDPAAAVVWQGTIGALGAPTWRRLTSLQVLVVGAGRTGSATAQELAQLGVGGLTLLDPDRLELGNLGEMRAVGLDQVGLPKVAAVGATLSSPLGRQQVTARHLDLQALDGLIAIKRADVVIGCLDNARARDALAVAALYNRPVLDIGTGVLAGQGGRRWGLDVRLVLPGNGCLRCLGDDQAGAPPRAGSLRSLNQVAVGLGVRLLEELALGTLTGSRWVRVEYGADGDPVLTTLAARQPPGCSCCALTGTGDAGLGRWLETD